MKNPIWKIPVILILILIVLQLSLVTSITPSGGSVTEEKTGTSPVGIAGSHEAIAGNVTELSITGFSTTQTWQGYYGNVSGTIQLGDSSGNVLYNWSLANPQGEVYASTNSTIEWTNVQCFNFTASGTYSDESGNGGQTNLAGTNLTILESMFNIPADAVDGVDETFALLGAGTHDLFYTASQEFVEGECPNTRMFDSTGAGVNNNFENVLLYEPTTSSVIFTSILDNDLSGFDSASHDFQMVVLEDGRGTDIDTTTYYFFVELE